MMDFAVHFAARGRGRAASRQRDAAAIEMNEDQEVSGDGEALQLLEGA